MPCCSKVVPPTSPIPRTITGRWYGRRQAMESWPRCEKPALGTNEIPLPRWHHADQLRVYRARSRLRQSILRKELPHQRTRFEGLEHHVIGVEVTIVWPTMRHASDRAELYLHALVTALVRGEQG